MDSLEKAIARQHRLMTNAVEQEEQRAHFKIMKRLIEQRDEQTISDMEKQRGLRK